MSLLILKFGGTSVATLERIAHVADLIIETVVQGHEVVVVVSAMAGQTDHLIQMAKTLMPNPNTREYSALLATGEQVSVALMAMALQVRGYSAQSFTGWQAGILTDHHGDKARIEHIYTEPLMNALQQGIIPVVAGFQGVDEHGNITTLGRGGSDTTAVALAAALNAHECRIYTDVDGVYTTDPRIVPQAHRLDQMTVEEMLELSSLGAKVLQIRSVEFAGKYGVPLRVLSSFTPGSGTLISDQNKGMEEPLVSGVAFNRNEAKLTIWGVPDKPGIAAHILDNISNANIGIDMILQNGGVHTTTDFTFTVHRDEYFKALEILTRVSKELGARGINGDTTIAKLSIVGVGMRSHVGVAAKMFKLLGREGINIQLISTSEIKISVIIEERHLELGVKVLHAGFGLEHLAKQPLEVCDPLLIRD